MILRHQFCLTTAANFLTKRLKIKPYYVAVSPALFIAPQALFLTPQTFIFIPRDFNYNARHVLSLRMKKALILAIFFNILRFPPLSKAFTLLNKYFKYLFFIITWLPA